MSDSPVPIFVPDLGSGDEPMRVALWLLDVGLPVVAGERLVELILPGITFDVTAPCDGVLCEIRRQERQPTHIGDILGHISPL